MKISKKQLKQIIKEEMTSIEDNMKPDVARTQKMMDSRGISKLVSQKINTWQELQELLSLMIQGVQIKDNQKLMVLRKLVQQLQGADGAPPQDDGGGEL